MSLTRLWKAGGRTGARPKLALAIMPVLLLAGCAVNPGKRFAAAAPPQGLARELAGSNRMSPESARRLATYLSVSETAAAQLAATNATSPADDPSVQLYNGAVADFVENWSKQHRPATVRNEGTRETFTVRMGQGAEAAWPADYFESFVNARTVNRKGFGTSVMTPGVGGTLVGVHREKAPTAAPPRLEPLHGFRMPVTAILRFRKGSSGTDVELTLLNPRVRSSVVVSGRDYPLAGDFTAPVASYPRINETWLGIINMVRAQRTASRAGLYMLEPYDPTRIPVVLIHGLLSSGFTWRKVGNAIAEDPEIRRRYQFWVFFYPTGNPILASALRLREDLALARDRYGLKRGVILVGHSMGGLLARLQVTQVNRSTWERVAPEHAQQLFALFAAHPRLQQACIFNANPAVKRVIFISTPHRGSSIASGGLGAMGDSIIRLPHALTREVPAALLALTSPKGQNARIPTSIDGLSPRSPLLQAMNQLPIRAPHHSIIGDRGRGDTPNSSDGVVPYWSSHLATSASEKIVPSGHSSLENPFTIAEVQRILRLHAGRTPDGQRQTPALVGAEH
ncbi:MAG TPA: alpha/beta fold hydrolase [Chthoniobacterales bacterium]